MGDLLAVRDLTKSYGKTVALNGVSFALGRGVTLGVVGIVGVGQEHPGALPGRIRGSHVR